MSIHKSPHKQPILKLRGGLKINPVGFRYGPPGTPSTPGTPSPTVLDNKFLPRSPEIKELCGLYTTEESPLYKAYKASGSKLKFSRWLYTLQMGEVEIKEAIEESKQIQYRVSGGVKAILRCSITPHYSSCYNPDGSNAHVPYRLLTDSPAFAIVYTADKAGHYTNRFFIGIGATLADPDQKWAMFYRPYGEMAVCKKIAKDLARRIRVLHKYKVTDEKCLKVQGKPGMYPPDAQGSPKYTRYQPDAQPNWMG